MPAAYPRELYPENTLFMPGISTRALPTETAVHVWDAYKEVKYGPRVGIIEERDHGHVPVTIDNDPPYNGVTEFVQVNKGYEMDVETKRVGISNRLHTYTNLPNRRVTNYKKRVARHEFMHVLSEKLLKYMDVSERVGTMIMESFAEYGDMKARPHKKDEVIFTSPYTPFIKFGIYVDKFYKSEIDGAQGYSAFIRDIQKYKSAKAALSNLGRNIRKAVDSGMSVMEILNSVERSYEKEKHDAYRAAA